MPTNNIHEKDTYRTRTRDVIALAMDTIYWAIIGNWYNLYSQSLAPDDYLGKIEISFIVEP